MPAEGHHSPFAINVVDSSMAYATPQAAQWLNMIGQGGDRAYRRALLPIFAAHRNGPKAWVANLVDSIVCCISLVSIANSHPSRGSLRMTDDQAADLASFFIQRAKHMTLTPENSNEH